MGNPVLSSRLHNQTFQSQFMMAIISKLQLALVCFLFSLLVDPSEARGRGGGRSRGGGGGFFVVIFGSESTPVWIGIGIAISVLSICCCICRCMMEEALFEEEIETRFQNQPMPAGPVPYTVGNTVPYAIANPVPYTIDMNNQPSPGALPPNYKQATSWKDAV